MSGFRVGAVVVVIGVLLGFVRPTVAQEGDVLKNAREAYLQGAKLLGEDPRAAELKFEESRTLYRRAVDEVRESGGNPSADLLYNLGNAAVLAGRAGEAVLWYKRAERLDPTNQAIVTNLAAAREKAGMSSNSPTAARSSGELLKQLTLIEFVPAPVRFWAAVAAFAMMWILALWRLSAARWIPSRIAVGACGVLALLTAASLVPRELRLREPREAVVMAETTGRAGPDDVTYEAKPASPLKAGTEVRVMEERGAWLLVELGDGTTTWMTGKSVERVRG